MMKNMNSNLHYTVGGGTGDDEGLVVVDGDGCKLG